MTPDEFQEAKQPQNVERLLEAVEDRLSTNAEKTAYSYLIDYVEEPDWFASVEGQRLLLLCFEVLQPLVAKAS